METLEESGNLLHTDFNGLSDGVSLLEMVEGAISALHQVFILDPDLVALFLNFNFQLAKAPLVAKLVYSHSPIMNILVNVWLCDFFKLVWTIILLFSWWRMIRLVIMRYAFSYIINFYFQRLFIKIWIVYAKFLSLKMTPLQQKLTRKTED